MGVKRKHQAPKKPQSKFLFKIIGASITIIFETDCESSAPFNDLAMLHFLSCECFAPNRQCRRQNHRLYRSILPSNKKPRRSGVLNTLFPLATRASGLRSLNSFYDCSLRATLRFFHGDKLSVSRIAPNLLASYFVFTHCSILLHCSRYIALLTNEAKSLNIDCQLKSRLC